MTYTVVCPPCGHVHKGRTPEELVKNAQAHASKHHGHTPSRDEILAHMKTEA